MQQKFQPGDMIIYRKTKHGVHPGPRASNVHPSANGDTYNYTVDKFWIVEEVTEDGTLIAKTRRGKLNYLKANDLNLQKANFLQRLWHRSRFSALTLPAQTTQKESSSSLATR
ncbi:MAG: hypothetical protein ABJZ55_00140 [Fuerstiella sp.]